jgi:hypothetical protein
VDLLPTVLFTLVLLVFLPPQPAQRQQLAYDAFFKGCFWPKNGGILQKNGGFREIILHFFLRFPCFLGLCPSQPIASQPQAAIQPLPKKSCLKTYRRFFGLPALCHNRAMSTKKLNHKNKNETSKTPKPPAAAEDASSLDPSGLPSAPRSRNGKIARLSLLTRALLNQRLDDGQTGPVILDWLNALPETRSLLADSFDGVPISLQNLSQWRLGGFVRWQKERHMEACWQDLSHFASYVEEGGPNFGHVADDLVTVLSAQYAQLVTAACGLDGGEFPEWEKRLQALRPLLHDAIQLQQAMQRAADHQRAVERAQKVDEAEEVKEEKALADARDYPRRFNEILNMMLQQVKTEQDSAQQEDEEDDDLPTDQMEPEAPAETEAATEGESKPIKANQSQSNPNTAAPSQSVTAPTAEPATNGPHGPEGPEPARGGMSDNN